MSTERTPIWLRLKGREDWKLISLTPQTLEEVRKAAGTYGVLQLLTRKFGYTALPVVQYTFRNPDTVGTFEELRTRNLKRCEAANGFNHPLHSWTLTDWSNATFGECGEAANVIKELKRWEDKMPEETPEDRLREQLADEIGDVVIYLDLLAQRAGLRLEDCAFRKFEKTSLKIGYVEK